VRWDGFYQPLSELSPAAQELFQYKPEEAKKLLAEAGYPKGFSFDMQVCSCAPYHMDVAPMLQAYYQRIGVKMNIKTLEYGAYRSQMRHQNQAVAYLINNGEVNPLAVLRKSYVTNQTWNPSFYANEEFDAIFNAAVVEQDQDKQREMLRQMNRFIIEEAVPQVWLPTENVYRAWWPWVKNYGGELRVGAMRPGPIYARAWIDEKLKKQMGY
jgi:peptide/nickel transport system substrate-binding protein